MASRHVRITQPQAESPTLWERIFGKSEESPKPETKVASTKLDKVPTPPEKKDEGMVPDWMQNLGAGVIRVAGPIVGGAAGTLLDPFVGPAGTLGGGALGGGAGEYLAEKVEPGGLHRSANPARVAVNAALGAVPGSALVKTGKPLASAAAGGLFGYAGVAGNKLAEGEGMEKSLNPAEWSGSEVLMGPALGAGVGGVLGKFLPHHAPAPPKDLTEKLVQEATAKAPAGPPTGDAGGVVTTSTGRTYRTGGIRVAPGVSRPGGVSIKPETPPTRISINEGPQNVAAPGQPPNNIDVNGASVEGYMPETPAVAEARLRARVKALPPKSPLREGFGSTLEALDETAAERKLNETVRKAENKRAGLEERADLQNTKSTLGGTNVSDINRNASKAETVADKLTQSEAASDVKTQADMQAERVKQLQQQADFVSAQSKIREKIEQAAAKAKLQGSVDTTGEVSRDQRNLEQVMKWRKAQDDAKAAAQAVEAAKVGKVEQPASIVERTTATEGPTKTTKTVRYEEPKPPDAGEGGANGGGGNSKPKPSVPVEGNVPQKSVVSKTIYTSKEAALRDAEATGADSVKEIAEPGRRSKFRVVYKDLEQADVLNRAKTHLASVGVPVDKLAQMGPEQAEAFFKAVKEHRTANPNATFQEAVQAASEGFKGEPPVRFGGMELASEKELEEFLNSKNAETRAQAAAEVKRRFGGGEPPPPAAPAPVKPKGPKGPKGGKGTKAVVPVAPAPEVPAATVPTPSAPVMSPEVEREVKRIVDEMETFSYTPRTWNETTGQGSTPQITAGSGGAPVYHDVIAEGGSGTRGNVRAHGQRLLEGSVDPNKLTKTQQAILEVARKRAAGDRSVSKPWLPHRDAPTVPEVEVSDYTGGQPEHTIEAEVPSTKPPAATADDAGFDKFSKAVDDLAAEERAQPPQTVSGYRVEQVGTGKDTEFWVGHPTKEPIGPFKGKTARADAQRAMSEAQRADFGNPPAQPPAEGPLTVDQFAQALAKEGDKPLVEPPAQSKPAPPTFGSKPTREVAPPLDFNPESNLLSDVGPEPPERVRPAASQAEAKARFLSARRSINANPAEDEVAWESFKAGMPDDHPANMAPEAPTSAPAKLYKSPLEAAGEGYGAIKAAKAAGEKVPEEGRAIAGKAAQRLRKEADAAKAQLPPEVQPVFDKALDKSYSDFGDLAKMSPEEQEKILAEEVARFKAGKKGGTTLYSGIDPAGFWELAKRNPEFLGRMGLAAGGALAGAAMTPDDPLVGALVGGSAGAFGPSVAKALIARVRMNPHASQNTIEVAANKVKDYAESFMRALPDYQRFALLAHPINLPINMWVGPYGSAVMASLEHILANDSRGWEALKQLSPRNFGRMWYQSIKEAEYRIANAEERTEGQLAQAGPAWWRQMSSLPGQGMTAGDIAIRDILKNAGFSEEEARRITLTNEPRSGPGHAFAELKKSAKTEGGKRSWLINMMMPFYRTATNQMENSFERLPAGIGLLYQKYAMDVQDPRNIQIAQQLISNFGVTPLSFGLGTIVPKEDSKYVVKFLNDFGGQYGNIAAAAFVAGQAYQGGKSEIGAVTARGLRDLPLPDTQVPAEMITYLRALLVGDKELAPPWASGEESKGKVKVGSTLLPGELNPNVPLSLPSMIGEAMDLAKPSSGLRVGRPARPPLSRHVPIKKR